MVDDSPEKLNSPETTETKNSQEISSEKARDYVRKRLNQLKGAIDFAKEAGLLDEEVLRKKGIDPERLNQEISELINFGEEVVQACADALSAIKKERKVGRIFHNNTDSMILGGREELRKLIGLVKVKKNAGVEVAAGMTSEPAEAKEETVETPAPPAEKAEPAGEIQEEAVETGPEVEEKPAPQEESRIKLHPYVEQLKLELQAAREKYAQVEAANYTKWERLKRFFGKDFQKTGAELEEAREQYQTALQRYKDYSLEIHKNDNYQIVNLYRDMAGENLALYNSVTEKRMARIETKEQSQPTWKKKLQERFPRATQWLKDLKGDQPKWSEAVLKTGFLEGRQIGGLALKGKEYAQKIAGYVETYFGAGKDAEMQKRKAAIEKDVSDFKLNLLKGELRKTKVEGKFKEINEIRVPESQMSELDRRILKQEQGELVQKRNIDEALNAKISAVLPKAAKMSATDARREVDQGAARGMLSAVARPAIRMATEIEKRLPIERKVTAGASVAQLIDDMLEELETKKGLERYYKYEKLQGGMISSREDLLDELLWNFAIAHKGITHVLDADKNRIEDKPIIEKGDTLSFRETKNGLRLVLDKPSAYASGNEFISE